MTPDDGRTRGEGGARGRLVTIEGGEGVGKSTQARLLAEALAMRGIAVLATREPGGTPGAEAIRRLLLDDDGGEDWNAAAEALLFAAARSEHVARVIAPALACGRWVVCDRFVDSSRAYQGGAGGIADTDLMALHRIGSGGLLPDRTLLLDLAPEVVARRLAARDEGREDRIGRRGARYHDRVGEALARLALAEPRRFARVDAAGSVEAVHARVLAALAPLLEAHA